MSSACIPSISNKLILYH